ncbi:MAG: hypothetical protein M1826_003939 [Phylliscum demangeonii]|nr:MAG: hypothetical protein M1826_003939 [Phylliscum demangeonii]
MHGLQTALVVAALAWILATHWVHLAGTCGTGVGAAKVAPTTANARTSVRVEKCILV